MEIKTGKYAFRILCLGLCWLGIIPWAEAGGKDKPFWSDEFSGRSLKTENWNVICWDAMKVNREWQRYTSENIEVKNGKLYITARKEGRENKAGNYTSGRIESKGKREFLYGRIEARIKLPEGNGTWPAFWMLGVHRDRIGWPGCGEVDIMEHVASDPDVSLSAIHTLSSYGNTKNKGKRDFPNLAGKFRIFGVRWTPEKMEFYIDSPKNIHYTYSPKVKNEKTWPFDHPMYLILNLAVGGVLGGKKGVDEKVFPQRMIIDWVRVYREDEFHAPGLF